MWLWLKEHRSFLVILLVTVGFVIYCYGCEPRTRSLRDNTRLVNRQELQLELDQIIGLAQLRMVDLEKQERFRAVILQNALILVQGQPLNPVGLLTAIAGIYGVMQGSRTVGKVVKEKRNKRKANNGTV